MELFIALFLFAPFNLGAAPAPTFECNEPGGTVYRIWLNPEKNALAVVQNEHTSEIKLAAANIGRTPAKPGDPLVYNGWKGIKKNPLEIVDMGTEFVTQYRQQADKSTIMVSLVVQHRERFGIKCIGSTQNASVVLLETVSPAAVRYADTVSKVANLRTKDGSLKAEAILTIESAVQRFANLTFHREPAVYAEFIKNITPSLVRVAPGSISVIGSRIPQAYRSLWVQILEDTKYRYFPETERYVGWVKEGAAAPPGRDLDSVRAGFSSFVRSPLFQQKDLKDFFVRSVSPSFAALEEFELNQVGIRLGAKEKAFLKEIWVKATGKKTIADYPEVEAMATELGQVMTKNEFDPVAVKDRFMVFFSTPLFADEQAKALYVEATRPHVKKLTPRQLEDLNGFLNDAAKRLLREMLN